MKWPATDNSNPKTWKCRIFGCRDERLPLVYYESDERHGITGGFSFATVATASTEIVFSGCYWCYNYRKIVGETTMNFPAWFCDCQICISANQHRKWLYEKAEKEI